MFKAIVVFFARLQFRLAAKNRTQLWRRISWLSDSGIPIALALDYMYDSKTTSASGLRFISHQRVAMRGVGFADGAKGWIPEEELILIKVTQEGSIADGFRQAARVAEARSKLRATIYTGMIYPGIMLLAGGAAIAILPGKALKVMRNLIDIEHWPPVSKSVLWFSEFIAVWGIPLAVLVILILILSVWAAPKWTGKLRNFLEWYPIFLLYRRFSAPEILSAWLALMQAGIQRVKALAQLEEGLPPYLAWHLQEIRSRLYRGVAIEQAFDTGLFSPETLDDLRIYERVGNFDVNAEQFAEQEIARSLQKLESTIKVLGSSILILVGFAAVWVYAGIARVALTVQNLAY